MVGAFVKIGSMLELEHGMRLLQALTNRIVGNRLLLKSL